MPAKLVNRSVAGALVLLLTGCAVQSEGPLRTGDPCTQGLIDESLLAKQLQTAPTCCTNLQSLPTLLPRSAEYDVIKIPQDAPIFDFPTGRSRFVVLDLRQLAQRNITLTPLSSTALTAPPDYTCGKDINQMTSRAIKPAVIWLDAQKSQVSPVERGSGTVTRGAAGWVFDRPSGAQYMVIFSLPAEHGEVFTLKAPSAGLILKTETVGLAAAAHPQRTQGPAKFTASGTGFYDFQAK